MSIQSVDTLSAIIEEKLAEAETNGLDREAVADRLEEHAAAVRSNGSASTDGSPWAKVGRRAIAADLEVRRGELDTAVGSVLGDLREDEDPTPEQIDAARDELRKLFFVVEDLSEAIDGAESHGRLIEPPAEE